MLGNLRTKAKDVVRETISDPIRDMMFVAVTALIAALVALAAVLVRP
jgi:hypothetical protein